MAMVFTLVSAIQEELTTLMEKSKQQRIEAEEKKKQAEEELERVCIIFVDTKKVRGICDQVVRGCKLQIIFPSPLWFQIPPGIFHVRK